ncbi:Plasma membrane low glucose sensor [Tilletia horrida]|nr:Plasma membrane low glucose sensor [Tilletia horrida]
MPVITEAVPSAGPVLKPKDLKSSIPAIIVGVAAAFGGFLYGYDTGTISGILAMEEFRKIFGQFYPDNIPSNFDPTPVPGYDLSTAHQSLVVSILSAGTFFGALLGAPLADGLGRKIGVQIALLIFCAGVAMQTASTEIGLLSAGRAIAGLGVGIISTIVPMYQSETAPRWIRGAVVSAYQWAITIGLLIAAIVNNSTSTYADTRCYRIPIAIQIGFAAILSFFFFVLPESPRWYIKKGNHEAALRSLARLNSAQVHDPVVTTEAELIQKNLDIELTHGNGGYLECFSNNERKYLLRSMTGIFLQAWQQLTGINFIFYYGTKFFKVAVPNGDAFHFTIISNVVNVVMTIPGMWWMDYIGRRDILIGGALWMTVCELIVAVVGTVEPTSNAAAGKSLVAFVCLYIAAFASTWGPAAWVVCGEIFPLAIRAKALSMCVASNWLWNFGIGYATPYLVNKGAGYAGLGTKVFFIWTATCFCSAIYAYLFIYETKGLSLEEVDEMYAYATPFQSKRANGEIRSRRIDVEGHTAVVKDDESATESAKREDVKLATE